LVDRFRRAAAGRQTVAKLIAERSRAARLRRRSPLPRAGARGTLERAMRGDGMAGLALAIGAACIALVFAPAAIGGVLGYLALRGRVGAFGALLGGLLGAGAGALAVTATFFESTWSPPQTLLLEVPAGFAHEWVVLIADPTASADVAWGGFDAPFTSRRARLAVPSSGVLRVRDLGPLDGADVEAFLSTGKRQGGRASLNAPPGVGPGRLAAFHFASYPGREPDLGSLAPAALAARLRALEAER
jgi:hypothetical protein